MRTIIICNGSQAAAPKEQMLHAGAEGLFDSRSTGLVREAELGHESEDVDGVSAIAAGAVALVGAAVEQRLAPQHDVWAPALLPDLQPVLHLQQRSQQRLYLSYAPYEQIMATPSADMCRGRPHT